MVLLSLSTSLGQQRGQPQPFLCTIDIPGAIVRQGAPMLVLPMPITEEVATSLDGSVNTIVRTKSGKPISFAHVQVRFTKPDGLCACKFPTQTLTANRHGMVNLRLPALGFFEVCASAPEVRSQCKMVHVERDHPEQQVTLTLLR